MKGAQTEVLKAVCQGVRHADDIARTVGMPQKHVYAHLRRLSRRGYIRVAKDRKRERTGPYKAYELADVRVLLADVWK